MQGHATDTYAEFVESNAEKLKALPPPLVALEYYTRGDLYMFDSFQTSAHARATPRRPSCKYVLAGMLCLWAVASNAILTGCSRQLLSSILSR